MPVLDTVRLSKNNKAQWTSLNPILNSLEIGYETDTKLYKIGDGVTHWRQLAYIATAGENALLLFLSTDANNLIGVTTDGGIILNSSLFNGVTDYNNGKENGIAAVTPQREFNVTMVRVGQDINAITKAATALANRVSIVEGKEVGNKIDDAVVAALTTWSSSKIDDAILVKVNALKDSITANSGGAYDALVRLATLLEDNASLAATFAAELAATIRFDIDQTLTAGQKTKARANIGAIDAASIGDTAELNTSYTTGLTDATGSEFQHSEVF